MLIVWESVRQRLAFSVVAMLVAMLAKGEKKTQRPQKHSLESYFYTVYGCIHYVAHTCCISSLCEYLCVCSSRVVTPQFEWSYTTSRGTCPMKQLNNCIDSCRTEMHTVRMSLCLKAQLTMCWYILTLDELCSLIHRSVKSDFYSGRWKELTRNPNSFWYSVNTDLVWISCFIKLLYSLLNHQCVVIMRV